MKIRKKGKKMKAKKSISKKQFVQKKSKVSKKNNNYQWNFGDYRYVRINRMFDEFLGYL